MFTRQRVDTDAAHGQDVEPEQHRPQPVLLTNMIRSGAGAFLAADRHHAGIEQVAEEFPARGGFEARDAQRLGHKVGRGAGRHGTGNALQARGIAGCQMGVGGQHRQRIRRGDEAVTADDQVAIAVAIRSCAEIRRIRRHHRFIQLVRVDKVGIGVMAAKILQRRAIAHSTLCKAQPALENLGRIRPGHRTHRVKSHGEAGRDLAADRGEIEQAFHQRGIIGDRIDDLHCHATNVTGADAIQIDITGHGQPAVNRLRAGKDGFGHRFRRRATVGDVVLDAEILIWPGRIVAGRQDQPAAGAIFADHVAGRRRRKDTALPDQHAAIAIGRCHADRLGDHHAIVETPVAADHQCGTGRQLHHVEHRLDEVFRVVRLGKHPHLLAQPGCAWFLPGKGRGGMCLDGHALPVSSR